MIFLPPGKEMSSTSAIITSSPAEQSQDAQEESTGGLVLNIDQVNNIQQKNKKEETDSGPSEHLDNPTPAESPLNSTNGSCLEPEQQELVPSKETVEITATMTQSETISREATEQENQDTSNHYITNTNNPLPDQSHCDSTSPKTPHRAVSPLEKRPRTLSLIGEKYSDLLSYNRPMSASSDETPIGKNYSKTVSNSWNGLIATHSLNLQGLSLILYSPRPLKVTSHWDWVHSNP